MLGELVRLLLAVGENVGGLSHLAEGLLVLFKLLLHLPVLLDKQVVVGAPDASITQGRLRLR